jgi:preprotein translocase subunit SecD
MSIMPALLNVGASPQLDSTQFKLVATALGVVWYSVFLVLFYRAARGNARQTFVVASLLVSVSFVFFATRLLH